MDKSDNSRLAGIVDTRDKQLDLREDSIPGYQLISGDSESGNGLSPLGKGGSGIVYRARQMLFEGASVDRAVKFFIYDDEILADRPEKSPISLEDFESEIANICTFNHQNLIRVVGAGFHNCSAGKIPYIVSDLVRGTTLKEVLCPKTEQDQDIRDQFVRDPDCILEFLLDVASAISHIHDQRYAHCDIAPKNIFVHKVDGAIKAVLGDLGLSKPLESEKKTIVTIIGSKKWMPDIAKQYCDQKINYEIFSSLQPYWDVYSFAKTGIALLEIFEGHSPRSWIDALRNDLEGALREGSSWTIAKLIDRMEFLKPVHREVARVPELSIGVGTARRKMMPVEALATTERLNNLVRHPGLLRLSKVPQITTAVQSLPGGNHTRYEHALGVTETMRRYLLSLVDESEFLQHLTAEKIEVAIVAAALSCGTRFPLSNIVHEIKNKDSSQFRDFSKHSLYRDVLRIADSSGLALQDCIREEFPNVRVKTLMSVLCGEFEEMDEADQLIYSLLHNSLDVRVIDFVRRDAHHLGIISGDSFKIDELLPHVTIHEHQLALKRHGISVAEQVILLRYWLFSRVYWNEPNRNFCAMARTIFSALHNQPEFLASLRDRVLDFDQRGMIEFLVSESKRAELASITDMASRLFGQEHTLFRLIFDCSRVDGLLGGSFDVLETLDLYQVQELEDKIWLALVERFGLNLKREIKPIIVDYPNEPGSNKMGEDVMVKFGHSDYRRLMQVSGIISGVNRSFVDQLVRFRVFIHPDLRPSKLSRGGFRLVVQESVSEYLRALNV